MELRALATSVLFGPDLESKLIRPMDPLTDAAPGEPITAPEAPARAPGLELAADGTTPVPGLQALRRDPSQAGRVLHAFANHELLAMELMALALLRFPDAPPAFRLGLAHTLLEEQEHLRLYLARLAALGVSLGDHPLSAFFWTHLRGLRSPQELVAAMSLTLEQANLDHARAAADVFAELGDHETAAVLERVLRDEIGHVAHGVRWLERWREPGESAWAAYRRWLPAPLTPARAKGRPFLPVPRLQAGLSREFVAELEAFSASRGRPPRVWWFNPGCEAELARGRAGAPASTVERALTADLAPLLGLVAGADDVVLVPELPSAEHTAALRRLGLARGALREAPPERPLEPLALEPALSGVRPWGWSPETLARLAPLTARLPRSERWPFDAPEAGPTLRRIATKPFAAELLASFLRERPDAAQRVGPPSIVGAASTDEREVTAQLAALAAEGYAWAVLKAPLGTSGRGQTRVPLDAGAPLDPTAREGAQALAWLRGTLRRQGAVLVAPWLERTHDLSLLLDVGPHASAEVRLRRAFCDARGQYRGHLLGRGLELTGEPARALHDGGLALLRAAGAHARAALAEAGYRGPAGVDAFLYRRAERSLLHPLVEVNPRLTFGRLAAAAGERLGAGAVGLLWLLGPADLRAGGAASFAALAARLGRALPLATDDEGRLLAGAVALNEPARARTCLAVLLAAPALDALRAALAAAGVGAPELAP